MLGLSAVVVAGAVGGNAMLIGSMQQETSVLRLERTVDWGQRITPADVSLVELDADVRPFAIPAAHRDAVVGSVAAKTLVTGHLVSPGDTSAQAIPGPGQRVVGVRLEPGHLPAGGLAPNDPVAVTPVTDDQATTATSQQQAAGAEEGFRARVVRTGPPDAEGAITVDLLVDEAQAETATQVAATGAVVSLIGPQPQPPE